LSSAAARALKAGCSPGRLEEIEAEIGWQDAANAIPLARFRERQLAGDDDVGATLYRRDDHVDTLRRAIERRSIPQIAFDNFRAALQQRLQDGGLAVVTSVADEQT
jgi:hypothetical protein